MSFQWLEMRIAEEIERRQREAMIAERLPRALAEVHASLARCVESYATAFGADAAEIQQEPLRIRILIREQQNGEWRQRDSVVIEAAPAVPGFQVNGGGEPLLIEVGILAGAKVFYRDIERDEYLTMDELTRRILDCPLFPKLSRQ